MTLRHAFASVAALALMAPALLLAQETAPELPPFDKTMVTQCLAREWPGGGDPASCIGLAADACMAGDGGSTTVGMGYCLGQELDQWDAMLNATYATVMDKAKATDAEMAQLGSAAAQQAPLLKDMQRKWIDFRDAACSYEASKWGGGTGGGPAATQCHLTLTAQQYLRLGADMDGDR